MGKALCHKLEKWLLLLSHITHKHFDYYSTLKGCFNLKLFNRLPGMLRSMITLLNKTSEKNITFLSGQESVLFTAKWQNKKTWKMSRRKSKTPSINSLKSTPFFFPSFSLPPTHWSLCTMKFKSDTQSSNGRLRAKVSKDDGKLMMTNK